MKCMLAFVAMTFAVVCNAAVVDREINACWTRSASADRDTIALYPSLPEQICIKSAQLNLIHRPASPFYEVSDELREPQEGKSTVVHLKGEMIINGVQSELDLQGAPLYQGEYNEFNVPPNLLWTIVYTAGHPSGGGIFVTVSFMLTDDGQIIAEKVRPDGELRRGMANLFTQVKYEPKP